MCSISGINIKSEKIIKKMIQVQNHRAPDENNYFLFDNLSLGMGRLKIIDLVSKNLCPYQEDEFILLYNGEIYNYLELRDELKSKWEFRTDSDTEVLLKCWREWGLKMFSKLNGMFSFCIFDKKKNKLILARDIAGEKPLYYYFKGKKFNNAEKLAKSCISIPIDPNLKLQEIKKIVNCLNSI